VEKMKKLEGLKGFMKKQHELIARYRQKLREVEENAAGLAGRLHVRAFTIVGRIPGTPATMAGAAHF